MSPKTKTIILEILYFPFRVLLLCWLAITWIILFLDMILPTVKGSKAERDHYNEGRYRSYNRSAVRRLYYRRRFFKRKNPELFMD